ncbi:hypothetical protein CKO50_08565 [Pseudoalteromonas sp. HM-SA03]|nr:hypothetical protein CKO50_08565 [Pseudoalteromonas sp. HM-SA03]
MLTLIAIFSGADGWKSIQKFGELQQDWLRHHCSFENDIPKRHCVANIIRALDADTLLEALLKWINSRREAPQKPHIAIDRCFEDAGKTMCTMR